MKNPTTCYAAIALGIIVAVIGVVSMTAGHHLLAYGTIVLGIIIVIAGVVALFTMGSKAV